MNFLNMEDCGDGMDTGTPIPFSFFVSLCKELSKIEPRSTNSSARSSSCRTNTTSEPASVKVFRRWVNQLQKRFPRPPPDTARMIFLMLFPEEDVRRKYGMQEVMLARVLDGVLDVNGSLRRWVSSCDTFTSSLGEEVYRVISCSATDNGNGHGDVTIQEVNSILDDLAAKSRFSASDLRGPVTATCRTRQTILQTVFRRLRPFEAAVLTQIILKDIRPMLYAVKSTSSTTEALLEFNSNAVHVLMLHEAMRVWDPSRLLLRCYKVQATIEDSVRLFESGDLEVVGPRVGVPVQIPKCIKGQGCKHALSQFKAADSVWAETKYDGERMQIHVVTDKVGCSEITIFSKSKRDSTLDRIATHWIIREALGLRHSSPDDVVTRAVSMTRRTVNVSSVILEAEMVAFGDTIGFDEFWRIRELIESTAVGARRKSNQAKSRPGDPSNDASRHLALVFFDILYLNGRSLLSESYCARRAILETVTRPIPKYAFLARRTEVPLSGALPDSQSLEALENIFSKCIANYEEGLVLKASHATYNDYGSPWVKMKKDYIPGYGDAVDLVLVAASWEKERGGTLRVPPSTFTTFYVAVLRDSNQNGRLPHLEVLFTVSYGPDRKQLEQLNFLISSMSPLDYAKEERWSELPFTFSLAKGLAKPKIMLSRPLLVELFGAGFTKSCEGNPYELRFPRISKVYRAKDRSWQEGLEMRQYMEIAHKAVGKGQRTPGQRATHNSSRILTLCQDVCPTQKRKSASDRQSPTKEIKSSMTAPIHARPSSRKRQRTNENEPSALDDAGYAARRPFGDSSLSIWEKAVCEVPKEPLKMLSNVAPYTCIAELASATASGLSDDIPKPDLHPFARFLEKAVILTDCCFTSPTYDRAFIERFVVPNAVHSWEALVLGCGWVDQPSRSTSIPSNIYYGVVFADKSSRNTSGRAPLVSTGTGTLGAERKPVFVFDSDCLRADRLDASQLDGEVDIKARCLAVYF